MEKKVKLSKSMTEVEFDNGYWYIAELKRFGNEIGVPSVSKLRKDELETCVKHYLRTGEIINLANQKPTKTGIKDSDKGLNLRLLIENYTNNEKTKEFIVNEAKKIDPDFKEKSGARYRLNRWREEQIAIGKKITYGDLVDKYVGLNQNESSFPRIEHGRYINFVADYLAYEKEANRQDAIKAWHELKELNIPKTYDAWKSRKIE